MTYNSSHLLNWDPRWVTGRCSPSPFPLPHFPGLGDVWGGPGKAPPAQCSESAPGPPSRLGRSVQRAIEEPGVTEGPPVPTRPPGAPHPTESHWSCSGKWGAAWLSPIRVFDLRCPQVQPSCLQEGPPPTPGSPALRGRGRVWVLLLRWGRPGEEQGSSKEQFASLWGGR